MTIWEVILGFIMFSKLKDTLVAYLVDVPFTALPLKSRVRKISSWPMVFLYWFQCSTFLIQSSHSWLWWYVTISTIDGSLNLHKIYHVNARTAHARRISSWTDTVHHKDVDFLNQLQ